MKTSREGKRENRRSFFGVKSKIHGENFDVSLKVSEVFGGHRLKLSFRTSFQGIREVSLKTEVKISDKMGSFVNKKRVGRRHEMNLVWLGFATGVASRLRAPQLAGGLICIYL